MISLENSSRPGRTRDLRWRFGALLAIALLPLLALSVWQSYHDYQRDTRFQQMALDEAAEAAVSDIVETLDTAKSVLRLAADLVDPASCQTDMARILRDFPKIYNMGLVGPDGEGLCSVKPVRLSNIIDKIISGVSADAPFWLEVLEFDEDTLGPQRTLLIGYGNYTQDGNLQNVIMSAYDLSALRQLRNKSILPNDIRVSIFARGGRLLVGEDDSTLQMRGSLADLLETEDRVIMSLPDVDGAARRLTLLPTQEKELFLAVSAPEQSLLSWNRINPLASALLPLLGWAFGFAAIWLALENLVLSRIRAIRRDVQNFARTAQIPPREQSDYGNDAIGALGDSFRNMAEKITDRDQDLTQSLAEKENLLREIHHRVKNNLQIIISLLNMSKRQVKDPLYTQAIDDTRNRIVAISHVHKSLHESEAMDVVDVRPFIEDLTTSLSRALNFDARNVTLSTQVEAQPFDADTATPIALFLVEALTNAAKHGLPQGGHLSVDLIEVDNIVTLTVTDDGIGADAASLRETTTPELRTATGTGQKLMSGFARQLGGTYVFETSDTGYICHLEFPKRDS